MPNEQERALRISQAIEIALAQPAGNGRYTVTKRNACAACPPSACKECGLALPGDVIILNHSVKGKRHLSDKAVHYLGHGLTRYQTGYVYRGEPVVVDLDLSELEGYLDLAS